MDIRRRRLMKATRGVLISCSAPLLVGALIPRVARVLTDLHPVGWHARTRHPGLRPSTSVPASDIRSL